MAKIDLLFQILQQSAQNRGFIFQHIQDYISLIRTDIGDMFFSANFAQSTSIPANVLCKNKWLSKLILKEANINTPDGILLDYTQIDLAKEWLSQIDYNVAIKPFDSLQGQGVSLSINKNDKIDDLWYQASKYSKKIILEEMVYGQNYRVFIIDKKVVAVTLKLPPYIICDGKSTIKELIEKKNEDRENNKYTAKKPINIGSELILYLAKQNLSLDSILAKGTKVELSLISNVSAGGESIDVTDEIHQDFHEIAKKVFEALPSLAHTAIDMIAEDITKSASSQVWSILEINSYPCLVHHAFPTIGKPRDVASILIDYNYQDMQKQKNNQNNDFSSIAEICKKNKKVSSKNLKREILYKAVRDRNLIIKDLGFGFWYIDSDKKHFFCELMPDTSSRISQMLANQKFLTTQLMEYNGINTAKSKSFFTHECDEAWEYAKGFTSCVVKPVFGTYGINVFLDIKDKESFENAVNNQNKKEFVVEEYVKGKDYRLVVIEKKFVAGIKRIPPYIIGDGICSIEELVKQKNKIREKNPHTKDKLIKISDKIIHNLKKENLSPNSVVKKGKKVFLSKIANINAGGESKDITDKVHIEFQKIASKIVSILPNFSFAGIDIIAEDISKAPEKQKWVLLEVNPNPGIHMHHFPLKGKARDVAGKYIDLLYPKAKEEAKNIQKKRLKLILILQAQDEEYKYWIKDNSYQFGVDGWVRNLEADKVEMVVDGLPNSVDYFIIHCIKHYTNTKVIDIIKSDFPYPIDSGFRVEKC